MGKCIYCGQSAGLFSNKHKECEAKYLNGKSEIIRLVEKAITEFDDFNSLKSDIEKIAADNYIKLPEIDDLYTRGYDKAVEKLLEDGVVTKEEEKRADKFMDQLALPQAVVDKNESLQKLVRASIIRDLTEGIIPEDKFAVQGHLPVNFKKDEKLLWMFMGVEFYEQRVKTHYEGGYAGVSFRVAKGVSYRTGGFKGHPVKTEEMKYISMGDFIVTNKNLYFISPSKNLKIQMDKILTMEPYEDGIGLQKDGTTAKPQVYKNLDGWFIYNVVSYLTQ